MIFLWPAILAALGRGLSAGMTRAASTAASAMGAAGRLSPLSSLSSWAGLSSNSPTRYNALRNLATAKRFATGALARNALRSGTTGSLSRLALAGIAGRRAKKRGKKLPKSVMGFLARDFLDLGRSIAGLPGKFKSMGDQLASTVGGFAQFSGQIAASEGQLYADRIRRAGEFARGISASEAYKNRAQSDLEQQLLPLEKAATNFGNWLDAVMTRFIDIPLVWTANRALDLVNPKNVVAGIDAVADPLDGLEGKLKKERAKKREDEWMAHASPEEKAAYLKRKEDQENGWNGPNDWWKSKIPDHHDQALNQLVSDIARGVHHSRKFPPLPPVDGGRRLERK